MSGAGPGPPIDSKYHLLRLFAPDPPAARTITDPQQIRAAYRHHRPRILLWTIIGYAAFYLVRKNLSVAMPVMEQHLGINKQGLGLFLTLHGVLYGVSKFANGILGDRANARTFMAFGLMICAVLNVCFGLSAAAVFLGVFWMLNGWFQGMGFPPCARLLTHWFAPQELATRMSLWNTSHSIGAGLAVVLCGYLVQHSGDWRLCFLIPAGIAIVVAGGLLAGLRDTPASVGLPPVEGTSPAGDGSIRPEPSPEEFRRILRERVFASGTIWIIALSNFFVYTIRYAVLDWGPTLLKESKGLTLAHAGWVVAGFELAGVAGMLAAGWLTDRVFGGRGARTCLLCMILCGVSLLLFWRVPAGSMWLSMLLLGAVGFFIYGPQALVGITAANLATNRAAATAVGLTSLFGYASTVLSGWGLGTLVEHYGWDHGYIALVGVAAAGTLLFALAWPARPHGYDLSEPA